MGDRFFVNPSNSRKRSRAGRPQASESEPVRSGGSQVARNAGNGRRKGAGTDEDITSESEAENDSEAELSDYASESDHETATDKRRRLAKEYLASLETELVDGFDAKDLDEDIIARRLRNDAAEQHGHIFRDLRSVSPTALHKVRVPQRNLTAIASASSSASGTVYLGSKDGQISKWNISGKPRLVRRRRVGPAVLCLCVNTANKLVVYGHEHGFTVLNAESLDVLREFRLPGAVLSCVFRKNTSELYVGGSDLRLRTYDLVQFAFVETLHGHQDAIISLSALTRERCVSVGSRDRTAIFWKIPEESRLTFRGGDTKLAARFAHARPDDEEARNTVLEGSIDCCAMLDHELFVTGSDNGNVSLWSTNRKKPQFTQAHGHGKDAALPADRASGETDAAKVEIPPQLPRSVTAVAAAPFANAFFTGSWSGDLRMWVLAEDQRSFALHAEIAVGPGIVTSISATEVNGQILVAASLSREPRLGRWLVVSGRDKLVTFMLAPGTN